MNQYNYTPSLSGLNVIKTDTDQHNKFFYKGHPAFLIPDFGPTPEDIWTLYLDFLEKMWSCEVYDQDGGEITSHTIIDVNSGLTKCIWEAYGIMLDEDADPEDFTVEVDGYVVEDAKGNTYFLATKVFEDSKI